MGNTCSSSCMSKDNKASCIFGTCENNGCTGMCTTQEKHAIESVIDEALKKFVNDHLHPILEAKIGDQLADLVDNGIIKVADIVLQQPSDTLVTVPSSTQEEKSAVVPTVQNLSKV